MKSQVEVILLQDARDFIVGLDYKSKSKVLRLLKVFSMRRDPRVFKKLNSHIWEFRVRSGIGQIRLLAFFERDSKTLVICTHGFIKKSSKVPRKEIQKAENLRATYLNRRK
jgi:phage-related protein